MKQLFDILLESLINKSDLIEKLSIEKSTLNKVAKILDTDDYDHFKVLGIKDMSDGFLFDVATHFEIKYEDNVLGVIGICFPKTIIDNQDNESVRNYIFGIFRSIHLNHRNKKFKDELFIDNDIVEKYGFTGYSHFKIAYVCEWAINQNLKKKLDINDFALVKVFFDKLCELLKENDCDYFIAHGKDERTSKLYIKLGKCISLEKTIYNYLNGDEEAKESYSKGIVGRKI